MSKVGSTRLHAASLAFILLISAAFIGSEAAAPLSIPEGGSSTVQRKVSVYLFWGEGCGLCDEEVKFLNGLQDKYPGLEVKTYEVWHNQTNLTLFEEMCKAYGLTDVPGVPTLFIGEDFIIGYRSDETTGKRIEELVRLCISEGCPDPIIKLKQTLTTTTSTKPVEPTETTRNYTTSSRYRCGCEYTYEACSIGTSTSAEAPSTSGEAWTSRGLLLFTVSIGLIDGFNPCSIWVFCLLLSLLLHASRRRMVLVGGVFIASSALVYLMFLEAWLTFNQILRYSEASRVILGSAVVGMGILGVKDFITSFRGVSLTIPASIKPRIYQGMRRLISREGSTPLLVSGVASLAFMVNMVELLCTAGLPAAYTGILSAQALPSMIHHAYLGVYVLFYMLDELALLIVFAVTLKALRPSIRYGRMAKLIGGILMSALGLIILFKPGALTFP
ncbi:MAG: hypothetical protein QW176_01880 [Candidatus Bathyarchaeia archaeon]